jgi:hypothetical protein
MGKKMIQDENKLPTFHCLYSSERNGRDSQRDEEQIKTVLATWQDYQLELRQCLNKIQEDRIHKTA